MWQIENRTPFAAAQSWVRDLKGAETWLVVVKGTFDILPDGTTRLSEQQPEPLRAPVYRGEPGRSSIAYDNDFVLAKTTTDIVVNGTGYAPGGHAAPVVDVRFQVGPVTKSLRLVGDRSWNLAGTLLSSPRPFVTMPITYERAYGGVDRTSRDAGAWYWPNPVGMGFTTSDQGVAHLRVANVEHPDDPIRAWNTQHRPAGFGVIGPDWQDRARFAGTYDEVWDNHRQPLLPRDFDLRFFQSVPTDQQAPSFLAGGEPVSLVNLTPSGRLDCVLPDVDLQFETHFIDGERRVHPPARLHSVILEPDVPRLVLVWHTALECHAKVYGLRHTRVRWLTGDEEEIGSLLDL